LKGGILSHPAQAFSPDDEAFFPASQPNSLASRARNPGRKAKSPACKALSLRTTLFASRAARLQVGDVAAYRAKGEKQTPL
jgi:hypothetical protein